MDEKISWYFEQNNDLLGENTLAVCYHANEKEVKNNCLTNNDILILIKNNEFSKYIGSNNFDLYTCLKNSFSDKKIFMRIQCECLLGMYGDTHCDCEQQRKEALDILKRNEGIYIHLPQEAQGYGLYYKLKELELQVNGRDNFGKYIGCKDRNEAQKIILKKDAFEDKRSYKLIVDILKKLNMFDNNFILITDNKNKEYELKKLGLKIETYNNYIHNHVHIENASEYLIKILEGTCEYNLDTLTEIMDIIKSRKYNERTINTFLKIIENIKTNNTKNMSQEYKNLFLDAYNSIICGVEKVYTFNDTNITKVQNKFSCKVNNRIFGVLKLVFNENIFNRISSEVVYTFYNVKEDYTVKVRHSKVLAIKNGKSFFLKGQEHLQQTILSNNKSKIIENEISKSKLQVYFESGDYLYKKKMDMITFISEDELDGVNVYIKRIPNIENHIMDVYGKKEKIINFINSITKVSNKTMLSMISNIQLEDEDLFDTNLCFANKNMAIEEELSIYNLLNDD